MLWCALLYYATRRRVRAKQATSAAGVVHFYCAIRLQTMKCILKNLLQICNFYQTKIGLSKIWRWSEVIECRQWGYLLAAIVLSYDGDFFRICFDGRHLPCLITEISTSLYRDLTTRPKLSVGWIRIRFLLAEIAPPPSPPPPQPPPPTGDLGHPLGGVGSRSGGRSGRR